MPMEPDENGLSDCPGLVKAEVVPPWSTNASYLRADVDWKLPRKRTMGIFHRMVIQQCHAFWRA
jgi:hypothetical protein